MPQFDFSTYSSQIFWFLICFALLYFFLSKKILPRISKIIEDRKNLIDSNLSLASSLEEKISQLKNDSQNLIKSADKKYKETIDEALRKAALQKENSMQEFRKKSEEMIAKTKTEITNIVENSKSANQAAAQELTNLIEKKLLN